MNLKTLLMLLAVLALGVTACGEDSAEPAAALSAPQPEVKPYVTPTHERAVVPAEQASDVTAPRAPKPPPPPPPPPPAPAPQPPPLYDASANDVDASPSAATTAPVPNVKPGIVHDVAPALP